MADDCGATPVKHGFSSCWQFGVTNLLTRSCDGSVLVWTVECVSIRAERVCDVGNGVYGLHLGMQLSSLVILEPLAPSKKLVHNVPARDA